MARSWKGQWLIFASALGDSQGWEQLEDTLGHTPAGLVWLPAVDKKPVFNNRAKCVMGQVIVLPWSSNPEVAPVAVCCYHCVELSTA